MPVTLTENALNSIQYVSIADYIRRVDKIERIEDKLAYTTRYLLAYGANAQRDVSLAEAIHVAKMKLADASAKIRAQSVMVPDEAVDPDLSEELDAPNRAFMIEPIDYLKEQASRLLIAEANKGLTEENQQRIENYQAMFGLLNDPNSTLWEEASELEVERNARDVNYRLMAKFGGKAELEKAFEATKPGILSRAFGTYSTAYHNLDAAYNAFNNPDHANYGNLNSLDKAALEYLQHVLPRWKPSQGVPSGAAIERLKGTKKARAVFSLNILRATYEQRKSEHTLETIVDANNQKRSDMEAQAGDEVLENAQVNNEQFQQEVLNDAGNDEPNAQDEKEYHDNFKDVPENEANPDDPAIE